ncbi:MAG TPA: SRPBCC family protein [Bacteroidales bacterium]|nr:SRPBCC family protein [Bacteroidales bacterium]
MAAPVKIVKAQMLIRRPVSEVFDAFIDPAVTSNFWFTRGSGKLEPGKTFTWEWEMYNVSTTVLVKEIVDDKKILIEWDQPPTTVEFTFTPMGDDRTYVVIQNYGFRNRDEELPGLFNDLAGGFTTVLDGLKAYLEHGIKLNLIEDKYPQPSKMKA